MANFFISYKRAKVAARMARPLGRHGRRQRPGFEANAPRSGPRTAGFSAEVGAWDKERKRSGRGVLQERWAMKLLTGWMTMSAWLVLTAAAANAQVLAPYQVTGSRYSVVSDVDGPYAGMPPEASAPRYGGPMLLPPQEVYTVVRESGFSPLGVPQQRGFVYTIAVIDRGGDDGRLVIDARTGRIIRFMPADRMGDNFNEDMTVTYGPIGPLSPVGTVRGPPRPPGSVPHVASRTPVVPMPKAAPPHASEIKPLAARPAPEPPQQSAAVQAKPAETTSQAAAPPVVEAKPTPQIQPTQAMPKVQGLD
jgi:hypothetical protein